MKPISLTISGLNSFIEPVEIDFALLTEKGVFGIFGPTGSGKSTILDAITLALYGDIPRNTKNYINANSKSAIVSFDFQISGKETKRYKVEREFRRESGGQNARTHKARLIDLTENVILEEKASAINEKCSSIIGLSKEDFGRTVVLPQGKFSEFLKLEGSKKREMLERLFNLEQYGDELITKVNKQSQQLKSQKDNLEGYLASYVDLEDVDIKALKEIVKTDELALSKLEETIKQDELKFQHIKNQWEKQQELEIKKKQKLKLEESGDEYKKLEISIEKAKQAKIHIPYIKNYETLVKEEKMLQENLKTYKTNLQKIQQEEIQERQNKVKLEQEKIDKQQTVKNQENLVKSLTVNLEGRNHLQEIETQKARITNGKEMIKEEEKLKSEYQNSLKNCRQEEKNIEEKLNQEEQKLELTNNKIIILETKKEEIQKTQMAVAISQNLHCGDDCPVCGNKIQNLVAKTQDNAFEHIEEEKKQLQIQKQTTEKSISNLKQEQGKAKGQLENLNQLLEKTEINLKKYETTINHIESSCLEILAIAGKILEYKGDINTWDSSKTLKEIKEQENQKIKEEATLETLRINLDKAEQLLNRANQTYQSILLEKAKLETTAIESDKMLQDMIGKLENSKIDIQTSFKMDFNLINIEQVKLDFVPEATLDNQENEVNQYKKQMQQLIGIIQNLESQIKTTIKEEKYQEELQKLNQGKAELSKVKDAILINKEKIQQTQKRIKEQKEALENLGKITHKLGLVEELKKLFQGKRFVSYVARNQLSYIAREASKRLMDITGGSYEIQVDDDGKFQIIDYKNGATVREVASLSGGEVFIASLALALALAAHIQLKGASLELFFLDEGFGTLDEDLLEVVMTSIEKIKSDKMAIGLISHVESIKQRVPVKLIITPAESGGIGTKAKIEY